MGSGISILLYLGSLFILYIIIETAVRKGINNSIVGRHLEEKYGANEVEKSFFDDDLDQD